VWSKEAWPGEEVRIGCGAISGLAKVEGGWMTDIWTRLLRFWPVVAAGLFVLFAGVRMEVRVQNIREDLSAVIASKRVDIEQWKLLRSQGHRIVDHERRLLETEQHITPESIQAWGMVRATVAEDHRRLEEHLRGH